VTSIETRCHDDVRYRCSDEGDVRETPIAMTVMFTTSLDGSVDGAYELSRIVGAFRVSKLMVLSGADCPDRNQPNDISPHVCLPVAFFLLDLLYSSILSHYQSACYEDISGESCYCCTSRQAQ
jgi:hypothetical protein